MMKMRKGEKPLAMMMKVATRVIVVVITAVVTMEIVKSKDREGHILALRKFFERIQFYKLRLNPKKHIFGVTSKKLLGFMVSQRGIEVDLEKIKVIMEMKPPRPKKEI